MVYVLVLKVTITSNMWLSFNLHIVNIMAFGWVEKSYLHSFYIVNIIYGIWTYTYYSVYVMSHSHGLYIYSMVITNTPFIYIVFYSIVYHYT